MVQKKLITLALAASMTQLVACGGDDDKPEGTGALPITFSASNAENTLQQAIADIDISSFDQFSAAEVDELAPGAALSALEDKLANIQATLDVDSIEEIASGAQAQRSGSCTNGGTWVATGDSVTITGCVEGSITINGTIGYVKTTTGTTTYTKDITGDVGFTKSGFTLTLKDLIYHQTVDTSDDTYTIDPFSFTLNVVVNGYAFSTPTPITGVMGSCPSAGAHTLTGAGNTRARATYDNNLVVIEVDDGSGTFTAIPASPVACTGWY